MFEWEKSAVHVVLLNNTTYDYSTAHNLYCDLKLNPFKTQLSQRLLSDDKPRRLE